jgi:hypothetical protein
MKFPSPSCPSRKDMSTPSCDRIDDLVVQNKIDIELWMLLANTKQYAWHDDLAKSLRRSDA